LGYIFVVDTMGLSSLILVAGCERRMYFETIA